MPSNIEIVMNLINRNEGATQKEITDATKWSTELTEAFLPFAQKEYGIRIVIEKVVKNGIAISKYMVSNLKTNPLDIKPYIHS